MRTNMDGLMVACMIGDLEVVNRLAELGAEVDHADQIGWTGLMAAYKSDGKSCRSCPHVSPGQAACARNEALEPFASEEICPGRVLVLPGSLEGLRWYEHAPHRQMV